MTEQDSSERGMTLFEEVMALDFPESEKARIGRALTDRSSLQARVLAEKSPLIRDNEFWGRGQKKFKIKGFRVGHPEAVKRVIARSFAAAKSHELGTPNGDWPLIWPLYERSVRIYLQDEMPELSELLKKEEFKTGDGAVTDQILRRIVSCLPLHQATLDQVRALYDLWGFERTESIDEILSRAPLEVDAARRMIDESVRSARKEIFASISSTKAELQRQIEQYSIGLESAKSALSGLQRDLRDRLSKANADVVLQPKQEVVSRPAKTPTPSSSPNLNQAALAAIESLRLRVESLGRQLKELRGYVERNQERREEHVGSARPAESRAPLLTTQQAIEKWQDALSNSGLPNSNAAGRVMWELVRRSRIVLASKPAWMTTLFASIASGMCRSRAVSPLWLSEDDWKEELAAGCIPCSWACDVAIHPACKLR
jgi:hypothetical protein